MSEINTDDITLTDEEFSNLKLILNVYEKTLVSKHETFNKIFEMDKNNILYINTSKALYDKAFDINLVNKRFVFDSFETIYKDDFQYMIENEILLSLEKVSSIFEQAYKNYEETINNSFDSINNSNISAEEKELLLMDNLKLSEIKNAVERFNLFLLGDMYKKNNRLKF